MIELKATATKLTCLKPVDISCFVQNEVRVHVHLDRSWDGLTAYLTFKAGDVQKDCPYPYTGNYVPIPPELMVEENIGKIIQIGLAGYDGETTVRSLWCDAGRVFRGILYGASALATPDMLQAIKRDNDETKQSVKEMTDSVLGGIKVVEETAARLDATVDAAASSASAADTAKTAAESSASAAADSAANASAAEDQALAHRTAAEAAAEAAQSAAGEANASASAAEESKNAAAGSAAQAAQSATEAGNKAADAEKSMEAAQNAQTAANSYAEAASARAGESYNNAQSSAKSAQAAAGSEYNAGIYAQHASVSAEAAGKSELGAAASAIAAETSETNAKSSETAAEAAKAAAQSAQSDAKSAADAAKQSEINAKTSETAAASSASAAAGSAAAAKTSADQANASETNAKNSADQAKTSETNAKTSEKNAKSSETAAAASADAAQTAASDAAAAKTAAQTAESGAKAAATAAENAKTAAKTAQSAAETARSGAETAQTQAAASASGAAGSASQASQSAYSADESSKKSESWAVGGTGTREDEETNNAKYWAEQAHLSAGAGVHAFNGRSGNVNPQKGDYTAEMVGADPAGSASAVQQNLNAHTGNTTVHITAAERTAWNAKGSYSKPTGGIPKTDLASGVQQSLANADSATAAVAGVQKLIPAQASESNQLADKAFLNSSIATNTAYYISDNGSPFPSLAALQAYTGTLTNNDYAFVVGTDAAGNTQYTRYKYNSATQAWSEEYALNNSSFTAEQWAAIQSGITGAKVEKIAQNSEEIQSIKNQKGAANGIAELDASGKVPSSQLPAMDYVPTSRKVNGKALSADITLGAADVGARPSTWTPTASDVGAVPTSRKVNNKALNADITLTAADVGARPSTWTPTASDVGAITASEVDTKINAAIGNAIGGSY